MDNGELSPTERKIYAILADGKLHPREELHACLPDELGGMVNLQMHLSRMRKKLLPHGQKIACELLGRECSYRLVRNLASPYDGKR